MKNVLLYLVLCLSATATFAQSKNITTFRNIPWGVPKDSVYVNGKKLLFLKDKGSNSKNAFMVNNDDMTVGNVHLNKVNYIFNDENRFFKVFLEGNKEEFSQMKFILNYKFGDYKNESRVDNVHYMQWLVKDVTFTLAEYDALKFELVIESNWQASEAYKKNTTVDDF